MSRKEKVLAKEGLSEPELVLDIDKNLLDDEWLNQPKLYFKWSIQLEDARNDLEEAKAEFDLVKSELDLAIRKNPVEYSELPKDAVEKNKVTEKMVAAVVPMQRDYQESQQAMFEAKYRVGVVQAAVASLDQRKRALEKIVDLWIKEYFASPRASEDSREAMEEVEKKSVRQKTRRGSFTGKGRRNRS